MRTGRASPHLLDRIVVDYYGAATPLKQLANVATTDARLLTLTPYDKNAIGAIEKAIIESDIGLTPNNDGNVIRLQIPELTEERRRDMVKIVHAIGEEGRIAIRNVRRDVIGDLRELKKEGDVGEDDERRAEADLQKLTDERDRRDRVADEGQGRRDPHGRASEGPLWRAAVRCDHHGRQRPLGDASAACRSSKAIARAPRRSSRPSRTRSRSDIEELTVYAFSTENWTRPADEVEGLMAMFAELIISETPELDEEGVRMRFIGRRDGVSRELREQMEWAETETAGNERMTLFVAFNYGGRAEILDAAERYEGGGEEAFRRASLRTRDE